MTGNPNRAERIIAFLEARYPGWERDDGRRFSALCEAGRTADSHPRSQQLKG